MELGHLLTHSGLTYPEVSSKVYHDSFCQLGSIVSLPWVIYFEAFYLHVHKEAKGSNPTTGLTLLWARNPFRGHFNHWYISRKEVGQIFFRRQHGCRKCITQLIFHQYLNCTFTNHIQNFSKIPLHNVRCLFVLNGASGNFVSILQEFFLMSYLVRTVIKHGSHSQWLHGCGCLLSLY